MDSKRRNKNSSHFGSYFFYKIKKNQKKTPYNVECFLLDYISGASISTPLDSASTAGTSGVSFG